MLPSHRLASGAEEKIVRVFESTKNFLQNLSNLSKLNVDSECSSKVRFYRIWKWIWYISKILLTIICVQIWHMSVILVRTLCNQIFSRMCTKLQDWWQNKICWIITLQVAQGASVPSLGLSNKAVDYTGDVQPERTSEKDRHVKDQANNLH